MTAAAIVPFLIAAAVMAACSPFAAFVLCPPASRFWLGGRSTARTAMVTTTGWTLSTRSPRSASSRARDRRSPGRHLVLHGRPPGSRTWPGARRRLIIRSLRGDLLGVFPPDRARSVVRQSNTEPLCAPAWPAIAGIGATPKDRYGATAPSASSARAIRPRDRAHDRGRCPLYVRAQLETAGLTGTQRDLAAAKATAREAGYTQLTGRFRR